jgi:hypothetical protein
VPVPLGTDRNGEPIASCSIKILWNVDKPDGTPSRRRQSPSRTIRPRLLWSCFTSASWTVASLIQATEPSQRGRRHVLSPSGAHVALRECSPEATIQSPRTRLSPALRRSCNVSRRSEFIAVLFGPATTKATVAVTVANDVVLTPTATGDTTSPPRKGGVLSPMSSVPFEERGVKSNEWNRRRVLRHAGP